MRTLVGASRAAAGLLLSIAALVSCSKNEDPKPAAPVPAPSTQAPSPSDMKVADSELDEQISKVFSPAADQTPSAFPAVTTDLAILAQDIMEKYPDKNAEELLGVPEVKDKLGNALKKLAADKELQNLVNGSVHLAAQIKGLEGPPGAHAMNLDLKTYDKPRTARMLQSVLSEDPKRVVSFLVQELGEAAVDLSYGGLEKSLNGISIVPNPSPPPAPAPPQAKQPD
jgi:hypothetical protein